MKKKFFLILLVVGVFLISPLKVSAEECTTLELEFYSDLATKIEFTPSVEKLGTSSLRFEIIISNGNDFLQVENMVTSSVSDFYYYNPVDIVSNDNTSYEYTVTTSSSTNCPGTVVGIRYINYPNYNFASNRDICEGQEEYDVCGTWYPYDLSDSEIETIINRYVEETEDNINIEDESDNNSFLEQFLNFITDNYIIMIIFTIILIILAVIMYYKKRKEAIIK